MKVKILALFVIFCFFFGFTSCASSEKTIVSKDQANAYFLIFEHLYQGSKNITDGQYLVVDLTNAELDDIGPLISLMQEFCVNNGYTLLQDTAEGLKEKGYFDETGFYIKDGFLVAFNDVKLEPDTLITSAHIFRAGLAAVGADFTVEKNNNTWQITKEENSWIS